MVKTTIPIICWTDSQQLRCSSFICGIEDRRLRIEIALLLEID